MWIDDGKIRGRVAAIEGGDRIVEIVGARRKGGKLKLEKGVDFPGAPLDLPPLSEDDLAALPVVAECADLIGFSFVQRPRDIVALDRALAAARPGGPPIPLVLKIETLEAVRNLPRLLVQAAGSRPTAAMIARGDLAVELGHVAPRGNPGGNPVVVRGGAHSRSSGRRKCSTTWSRTACRAAPRPPTRRWPSAPNA